MRPPVGASMAILDALRDGPVCVGTVVKETGLSQSNVSNHLGRLRSLGWVAGEREGRQVLYRITDYFVEQFVRSQERPVQPLGTRARRRIARELLPAFLEALARGAKVACRDLAHEAMLRGLTWQDLYMLLFTPALRELGERWQHGSLSVGHEHRASATVERLMARVCPEAAPPDDAPTAMVACVEGNFHAIGARMVADFLADAGWRVHYFGANTPTADLARAAATAAVVALSASQPEQLPALREAAAAIRRGAAAKAGPKGVNGAAPSQRSPLLIAGGAATVGQKPVDLGVNLVDRYLPRTVRLLQRLGRRRPKDRYPAAVSPVQRG